MKNKKDPEIKPYIAGQSPEDQIEEDINDCAICFSLQQAATALIRISKNIEMSCIGQSKKKDFGLEKSFIDSQLVTLKKMMKFHQYYHSTGESLNDNDFGLGGTTENTSPPKFKRFRPQ